MAEKCDTANFVLKTDDDQAVDVYHLPSYLKQFVNNQEPFYLCHRLKGNKPQRNPEAKWFVTKEEYWKNDYPDYCSGWAHVTNLKTIKIILKLSENEKYFWIDDLFVTGILLEKFPNPIRIYNWRYAFLSDHVQLSEEIFNTSFFSPELMVASDIDSKQIQILSKKFQSCHRQKCYQLIYQDESNTNMMRPRLSILNNKQEL